MSHNDFVRPSGQWPPELVPGASDWQRFDVNQSKCWNGDTGGAATPTSPIILGGAGLRVTGPAAFTGGVRTQTGGRLQAFAAYPSCNARARTLFVPLLECAVRVDLALVGGPTGPGGGGAGSLREDLFVLPALTGAGVGLAFPAGANDAYIDLPKRYLHNGGRLAKVVLSFVLPVQPAVVPLTIAAIQPISVTTAGVQTEFTPALSGAGWSAATAYGLGSYASPVAVVNGFYFKATALLGTGTSGAAEPAWPLTLGGTVIDNPGANQITWTNTGYDGRATRVTPLGVPVSPAIYYAGGAVQTLEFDTDTAGGANVIDTTGSRYSIWLANPDPAMIVTGLTLSYDSIVSLQPE